jgi:hypothetical protein
MPLFDIYLHSFVREFYQNINRCLLLEFDFLINFIKK